MKKVSVILAIIVVVILTWLGSSMINVQKAKNKEGIFLSPNKSKSVEFINAIGTSQLLMNFHENLIVGGSNIVSGNFNEAEIGIKWQNENTLLIEYPQGTALNHKEEELYFFGDTVKINYKKISEK